MDFQFTPEQQRFRQELKAFLKRELPQGWRYGIIEAAEEDWSLEKAMRQKLAQKGWLTLGWPKEYGGGGASITTQLVFNEEMAYHRAPGRDVFGIGMLGPTLMVHGTEEQKRKYLGDIARGEVNWCQFFSEPEAGSDLASLRTRAVTDGDDFVIHGQKIWNSGAHYADKFFMLARTDPDAPKHKGITFFLGDMNQPGIDVRPIVSMTGRHHFNEVFFDGAKVSSEDVLGEVNRGWYVAMTLLGFERSIVEYPASARRALDELVAFVKDTKVNSSYLCKDPMVRSKLTNMAVEIEVARMLAYRIAWMMDRGEVPDREGSIAKVFSTELMKRLGQAGMEVLGLYAQLEKGSQYAKLEGGIRHLYLESIGLCIAGGTSEIQRNVIALRGLGLPRSY